MRTPNDRKKIEKVCFHLKEATSNGSKHQLISQATFSFD